MALDRSKPPPISSSAPSPPPPRTLNVQKFAECRASELESLHAIIAERLNHDFKVSRGKRRRTTGHLVTKNRRRKRRRVGDGGEPEEGKKKVSRRVRRRLELQENPVTGFCVSGDGTKRLRTHIWHAKRFTMVKRWGFYLPLGLQGRGRGSRAVLKWFKYGAVVHDASYCCPIQLEGPEDSLLAVLRMVLLPPPSDDTEKLPKYLINGVCYENAMLYHVGTHLSRLIAPVMYMWRPVNRENVHCSVGQDHIPQDCSVPCESECNNPSFRQLWIWIHAAAFNEAFAALRFACQKVMHGDVNCSSLEGRFAKLEVAGTKACQLIKKILQPVSECYSSSDPSVSRCSDMVACPDSQVNKGLILEHAGHLPSRAVLSLTANDPRNLPSTVTDYSPETPSTAFKSNLQDDDVPQSNTSGSRVAAKSEDILSSLWSEPVANCAFLSDSQSLWGSSDKVNPPLQESILCAEKHLRRLKFFCLDHSDDATPAIGSREGLVRYCPILLLKHEDLGNCSKGWSIILPLSWAKVFWVSLVSLGAHAIGLRERRWIACNNGVPTFPFDFPDCKAYLLIKTAECSESDRHAELRPSAVRPFRVPIPPPWNCVISTIERGHNFAEDHQTPDVRKPGKVAPVSSLITPETELHKSGSFSFASSEGTGLSFQGFIPRTSNAFSSYMEKRADGSLLLFPKFSMEGEDLFMLEDNNKYCLLSSCSNLMLADKELCFARVLLHAYKEGVFEEGAVVCAPVPTDLSHWTLSCEEEESLLIPQSFVRSYFHQQDTGEWELQLPEDHQTRQGYRWPIGFVTSGFVLGSSKPVAIAFCEMRLLALLRSQQWNLMEKARPEIFVLVRNLRSNAYRRALATIVLEQQKDDTDFV